MIDSKDYPEWIDRYNRHDLTPREFKLFQETLKTDPHLKNEVEIDRQLNEVLQEQDILRLRRKLFHLKESDDTRTSIIAIYFLAACTIVLLGFTVHFFNQWANLKKEMLSPSLQIEHYESPFPSEYGILEPVQLDLDPTFSDSVQAREARGDSGVFSQLHALAADTTGIPTPSEEVLNFILREEMMH